MKIFDNAIVRVIISFIQIYVGLGFLNIVPGFTESGTPGKIAGALFILIGIANIVWIFAKPRFKN